MAKRKISKEMEFVKLMSIVEDLLIKVKPKHVVWIVVGIVVLELALKVFF